MTFLIELPDEDGNTSMSPSVIDGRIVQGSPDTKPHDNPDRQVLLIYGPPEIASRHAPGMYTDSYCGFAEVPGPARMLDRSEYDAIIRSL